MAAVFYKCGYIENWGRGTLNIIDYCLQAGLPKPEFAYEWGALRTTFYRKSEQGEGVNVGVNVGVKELLEFIRENQPVNAGTIAAQYPHVTQRTVERWLKTLRDQGLIEFKGAPRTGGYCVTDD